MMGKGIVSIVLAMSATAGFSQALTAAETEVDMAFRYLRSENRTLFRLVGAEYVGTTTTPIASDFFWDRPAISTAQDLKMELLEARNGVWTNRSVADGKHVWGIDLVKNTYSAARYGSYTAVKPTDYEVNGFQSLNVATTGQSQLLARMAREIWAGTGSMYRPWIPASTNRTEYTLQGAGGTYNDPVVATRQYVSTDTKKFHIYWLTKASVPTRSITFELNQDSSTSNWKLGAIYYSDVSRLGASSKLVDWKVDVYTGTLPSAGNFSYVPAAGSRAVAGPRPNGSG